ncbi:MAG TPA: phospholipase D-like domain-containing protein, partial [Cyclobacteriaceae bacterium]
MIIKKLAVPLINDKILQQAEHCYIATAGISEVAFDFIKNRLSPKCKIDIVTGLDSLTSPQVLRRIWRHYQDRITLRLYTRNTFHANVYIFDLPFRKAVAFTGSGELTMEGLKDHEEIFKKIIDPKEIEALLSW